MRLLNTLRNKPLLNNLHYLVITIILFILSLRYYFLFIALGIYLIFLIKKKEIFLTSLIIIVLVFVRFFTINIFHQELSNGIYTGVICDVDSENSYVLATINGRIRIISYKHSQNTGNYINVEIEFTKISDKSYDEDFSYKDYLFSKGIYYQAKEKEIMKESPGFHINMIKYNILKNYKNIISEESYQYLSALIFAENVFDSSLKDGYSLLGISHIVAVSGMHILFLYKIISILYLYFFHRASKKIPLIIITIYVIIIGAPSSALRALLFLLLGQMNKKGNTHYTRLDIFSISFMIMIIINPYQFYQLGFILSYLVSFILIYSNDLLKSKTKLSRSYETYLLIYFSTLPFVTGINNKITLISFIISPLLSIISIVLLPICYLILLFPYSDYILKYIFIFFNYYIEALSSISPSIPIKTFSIYYGLIYYLFWIIYIVFRTKNKFKLIPLSLFISTVTIYLNINYLNPYTKITFIDVGQGDGALISLAHNTGVIAVDCYNSFDYIKNMGIKKINYLILTHSDNDHIKDYDKILDYFDVDNILYSKYDYEMEKLLINNNNKIAISNGKNINLGESILEFIGPINNYDELNSNSIVFILNINNTRVLFTGDMTIEEEKDIINLYSKKLKCDILKVAHHASNTSSSVEFLNEVNPDYSIVSVGLNNIYNLPDADIIKRLNNISIVYETRYSGNINVYINKNKYFIQKYR